MSFPPPKLLYSPVSVGVAIERGDSRDTHIYHPGLSIHQHKVVLVWLKVHYSNVVLEELKIEDENHITAT